MAIHYVDTYEGSDANDGTSWGQAWKTCYPLKAIYGSLGTVSNLEVRFAKTPPVETGTNPILSARPVVGYRKPAIADVNTNLASVFQWGGTTISPFMSNTETVSPSYRPAGTFKFRLDAPAGASGLAARWALTDGNFSAFQCFEAVSAFWFEYSSEPVVGAEAWLEFATDINGTNIVWSRKMEAGLTRYDARMCLIGNSDLPDGVSYVFLRINNPTSEVVFFDCTGIHAVLPVTHPNYNGFRLFYLPNDRQGACMVPTISITDSTGTRMRLGGIDGIGIDWLRQNMGQPVRTWDTYRWEPFPYVPEALLPSCAVAGSKSFPLKVQGGWNKATNEVDGVSVIDAANLRWFSSAIRVSVDVRDVALTFRRTNKFNQQGTPGIMEYAGYGLNKQLLGCYAERVYTAAPGPGCVGEQINASASDDAREALVNAPGFGLSIGSSASFRNCNTYASVPFGGGVDFDFVEDSTWSQDRIRQRTERTYKVKRCVLLSPRPVLSSPTNPDITDTARAPTYEDCDIIAHSVSNAYGNNYACSPIGWLENCRLYGPYTGPVSPEYQAKNLQYFPIPNFPGPVCISGADIDGLTLTLNDPIYQTNGPMFASTDYDASAVKVRLKNSSIQMVFSTFVPASTTYDYIGHTIELDNVTLHRTAISSGAPFKSTRLTAKNLTMSGAWSAVQEGVIRMSAVDGLFITDANTKIVNNFRFSSPAAGWGRVCATYRNIVHPAGMSGFLGVPSSGYNAAGAAWFHASEGEMWVSSVMTVTRDTSVSHSGLSSWKMTPLQPLGAISRGSFMTGTVPVVAGVPVTFTAMMRRSSMDAIGGLFIRPAATRVFSAPETVNAPSLHDVVAMQNGNLSPETWEQVSVSYTPFRDGLVELHVGLRGLPGNHVWVDSLKVTQ